MARRASATAHPVWIVAAVLLGIVAVTGGYWIYGRVSDPFRTITMLPVNDYLHNSHSLRGNVYKLDATIAKAIEWSSDAGRLFSVESGSDVLPVLVPPDFKHMNIERGQRYLFKLEVDEKGVLRARDVKKT